ncbi:MAG: hypothetical protein LBG83_07065, partial [Oscillospiraceae bacterium]|nr:hypothetical protein [Oscillospiraceae bacterium]
YPPKPPCAPAPPPPCAPQTFPPPPLLPPEAANYPVTPVCEYYYYPVNPRNRPGRPNGTYVCAKYYQ